MPNIIMADQKGESMIYNDRTGAYYKEVMDITLKGGRAGGQTLDNFCLDRRWYYCEQLKKITIDSPKIVLSTKGSRWLNNCSSLEEIVVLGVLDGAGVQVAQDCPKLKTVVLGSIGYPCANNLTGTTFQNSGASAADKTITVYTSDSDSIPFSGAPFGLTGATVIYRSSTTGEVRTE